MANALIIMCTGMLPSLHRKLLLVAATLLSSVAPRGLAQGYILFQNYRAPDFFAPITLADGTPIPASSGFSAQLYGGTVGSSTETLVPLFPVNTFRPDAAGFLRPDIFVSFPGKLPGEFAEIEVRVFNGPTWETSAIRGRSTPLELRPNQGSEALPLVGLQSFAVYPVPEPGCLMLALAGTALLWRRLARRR